MDTIKFKIPTQTRERYRHNKTQKIDKQKIQGVPGH